MGEGQRPIRIHCAAQSTAQRFGVAFCVPTDGTPDQQNLLPRQGFEEWSAPPDFSLVRGPQGYALRQPAKPYRALSQQGQ